MIFKMNIHEPELGGCPTFLGLLNQKSWNFVFANNIFLYLLVPNHKKISFLTPCSLEIHNLEVGFFKQKSFSRFFIWVVFCKPDFQRGFLKTKFQVIFHAQNKSNLGLLSSFSSFMSSKSVLHRNSLISPLTLSGLVI